MPLIPINISALPTGTLTIDSLFIIELPGGQEIQVTTGQILAMLSLPTGLMLQNVYDINGNGIVDDSEELNGQGPSFYLDRANHSGTQAISTVTGLQTALDAKVDDSEVGVAGGVASLGATGKLPLSQLPFSIFDLVGVWDANTNTPTLADGTGVQGQAYIVSVAGSQNLGSGVIAFTVGNIVIHNGSIWQKVPTAFATGVTDITTAIQTGATGSVTIDNTAEIDPSADRQYMTDDQKDAADNANAPAAGNPFATINDLTSVSVVGSYPPSPDDVPDPLVAPVHANQTFAGAGISQATIDTAYGPGFATTADNVDWAAMQYRVEQSCANGTPMSLVGNYFMGSNDITMPKVITSNKFTIYGYSNNITFAGGAGWTRVRPVSLGENQAQQNTSMYFHHVRLFGSGAGIGFEPAANTNSVFDNLFIEGFATAGICRTTQNARFESIDIRDCFDGMIIRNEDGLGAGLAAQTASNGTRFWHPRYRHSADAGRAFQWFGSYGGELYGAQIEGNGSMEYPIYFDGLGLTLVSKFAVIDPHFESVQGFRQAAIFCAMREGVLDLVSPEHDIATTVTGTGDNLVMVHGVSGILSPSLIINIQSMNKWLPAVNGTFPNKYFRNTNCRWMINLWSDEIPTAAFWAGTAVNHISVGGFPTLTQAPGNNFNLI